MAVRPGLELGAAARDYAGALALLLDAHQPGIPGGTGTCFDWRLIPSQLSKPIVLAGGLAPDNVETAIRAVRPYGVDVSSGVEAAKGLKDPNKIAAFMRGVARADARQE
jgi:phosphoribosylanthranilate isomerase